MFLLRLLPSSKDGRYILALAVMALLLLLAGRKVVTLNDALSAKPKIEIHTVVETKIVEKKVAGPVIVKERIIVAPNGEKTTERTITRAEVTTEKGTDTENVTDRKETPVSAHVNLWTVTGSINPNDIKNPALGLSRSFGFLSIGLAHDVGPNAKLKDARINLGIQLF